MAISMYQPTPLPQTVADPSQAQILQNVQAQIQAERAAQMADALQQQANAPIAANNAPISPFQGLTKALQAYQAKKERTNADNLAIQAIAGQQQQEAARFNALFPGSADRNAPVSAVDPTTGAPIAAPASSPAAAITNGLTAPTSAAPPSPAPNSPAAALTNSLTNPAAPPAAMPDMPAPAMAPGDPGAGPPQNGPGMMPPSASPGGAPVMGAATQPPVAPPATPAPPQAASVPATPSVAVAHSAVAAMPSLTGDPNQDRLMAMQMGVPKYFEAVADRYKWTDQQKNDAAVGITASMRRTMDVAKSLQGAVVPGSSSTLSLDANGNPVATQVGGLQGNIASTTAATTAATQSQTPHEVKDAQGRSTFVYTTPPAATANVPTAGGGSSAGGGSGGQTTAGAAFQGDMGKAGVALNTKINEDADNAVQGLRTTTEMSNLLQGFTPGKGAPVLQAFGSIAEAFGVPPDKVEGLTHMNIGDSEAFQKGTAALAAESAKQMTNKVTQQEFKVYLANNPNWMMTPDGIKRAMDYMQKGFQQKIDYQQAWQQFTSDPKNDPGRYAVDFPAAYNRQLTQQIKGGQFNSSPAPAVPIRTRTDVMAQAPGTPAAIVSKADYDALPPGATFTFNGQMGVKPGGPARGTLQ